MAETLMIDPKKLWQTLKNFDYPLVLEARAFVYSLSAP